MEFQTRSEVNGLNFYKTFQEALAASNKDSSIWMISFSIGNERIRLVKSNSGEWVYSDLILRQYLLN